MVIVTLPLSAPLAKSSAKSLKNSNVANVLLSLDLHHNGSLIEKRIRIANRLQGRYIKQDFAVGKMSKEKRYEMLETFVKIISEEGGFDNLILQDTLTPQNACSGEVAEWHVETLQLSSLKSALDSLDLVTDGSEDVQWERLINRLQGAYDDLEFADSNKDAETREQLLTHLHNPTKSKLSSKKNNLHHQRNRP